VNAEQKQALRDRLMEGLHMACGHPTALVEFSEAVDHDIERLEPVIDAMLEAARNGSNPTNWMLADAEFTFLPDGANCLVDIRMGPRKFSVSIERSRMKSLGQTLIEESGL
jgi:hypothetical protein